MNKLLNMNNLYSRLDLENIHISVDLSDVALVCLNPHKLNAILFNY